MIIGICGFAKVGKDTAAANMPGFKRFAFADPLKHDVQPMLDYLNVDVNDPKIKEQIRPLLVAWGAVARSFIPMFWIDRTMERVMNYVHFHQTEPPVPGVVRVTGNVVITDVRYLNELDAIKAAGGKCVYIVRPGYGPANSEEERSIEEIIMKRVVPTVVNDGTPEELGAEVLQAVGFIGTAKS